MPSSSPEPVIERARPLLGTYVSIRIGGLAESDAHRAIEAGFSEIADIHQLMSFHETGSDVSRLNRDAALRPVAVDSRTFEVLGRSLEIAAASGGVFDVTVAARLVACGFLPHPASNHAPDPAASWRDIELIAPDHIRFHRPLWIDLGGIAKGFAVDRAMARMGLGATIQCCINAGGDLRLAGPEAERILLRGTGATGPEIPIIALENGSLASSSGREAIRSTAGRRAGPHLDWARRRPVGTRSFVSVAAPTCIVADALTKIVLARGDRAAGLLRRFGATAYLHTPRMGWRILGETG